MAKKETSPARAKREALAALGVEPNVAPRPQRLKATRPRRPPPKPPKPRPQPAWRAPLVDLKLVTTKRIKASERDGVIGLVRDVTVDFDPDEVLKLPGLARLELRMRGVASGDLGAALEALAPLRKLVWLDVRWADAIPPSIGALRGLRQLGFRGDWLAKRGSVAVPEELFELTRLERLDLSGGRLEEVGEGLGRLTKLEELNLGANRPLARLPGALGSLPRLRRLDLQCPNELRPGHVLPIVARLPRLEWFRYRSDRVTALPAAIADLRADYVDIGRALRTLPDAIGRLRASSLDIEFNDLRGLPGALTAMPNLSSLTLYSNPRLDVAQAVAVAVACPKLRWLLLPPAALPLEAERALVEAGFALEGSMYGALWRR